MILPYPSDAVAIVTAIANDNSEDIPRAVELVKAALKKLPDYDGLVDSLITQAVREFIYDVRHKANVQMKRDSGRYGGEAKVVVGNSKDVQDSYTSLYAYFIAGTTLGSLKGEQLLSIAESERSKAAGHTFNARLCEQLKPLVADDNMVKDCVPERKLKMIFKKAHDLSAAA